jgi:hypothetical protein|nr:MAG TPA: hypothetical protein [Caudoviricetes sp.]
MKALIKENGEERVLKEGTLEEIKSYLTNNLDNLLDWLEEEGNQWEDFTGLKNDIKENIKKAEDMEDLESAFEEINEEMSWWGVYFE